MKLNVKGIKKINDLKAYYPFRGNANDYSGYNQNPISSSGTFSYTDDRLGNYNSCILFDNGVITYDNSVLHLSGKTNFTMTCWYKSTSSNNVSSIIRKGDNDYQQWALGFPWGDTYITFTVHGEYIRVPQTNNEWHFVAFGMEDGVLFMYYDGTKYTGNTGSILGWNVPLKIGQGYYAGNRRYAGYLDDFRYYDRVLTVEEVDRLYTTSYDKIDMKGLDNNRLIFEVYTFSSYTTFHIPTVSGYLYDCVVDWGDGTTSHITEHNINNTHDYGVIDTSFTVTITGLCQGINFNGSPYRHLLKKIKKWGNTDLIYLSFGQSINLTDIEDAPIRGQKITSAYSMFVGCRSLKSIPRGLFDDSPNITNFQTCFDDCEKITSVPKGLFDNCSKVTTFRGVFFDCIGLESLPSDLFKYNTLNTIFTQSFYNCVKLKNVPNFSTNIKVTNFQQAFMGCTALTSIPEDAFKNLTLVSNLTSIFRDCTSLETIPNGLFDSLTGVINASYMFSNSNISSIPNGLLDTFTNVTDISYSFNNCNLSELPTGLFDNLTNCNLFTGVFQNCTLLESIPEGFFDYCIDATNYSNAFYNCTSLVGPSREMWLDNSSSSRYTLSPTAYDSGVPNGSGCYYNCTGLTDYVNIPTYWK